MPKSLKNTKKQIRSRKSNQFPIKSLLDPYTLALRTLRDFTPLEFPNLTPVPCLYRHQYSGFIEAFEYVGCTVEPKLSLAYTQGPGDQNPPLWRNIKAFGPSQVLENISKACEHPKLRLATPAHLLENRSGRWEHFRKQRLASAAVDEALAPVRHELREVFRVDPCEQVGRFSPLWLLS